MEISGEIAEQPANVFEIHRAHSLGLFRCAEFLNRFADRDLHKIDIDMLLVVTRRFDDVRSAQDVECSCEFVRDGMQRQTRSRNGTLSFNVNLFVLSSQLQRFDVASGKVLRERVSLASGKVEIREVLSLPSSGTDVAHAIGERVPILNPVNLDSRMTFLDGDWELFDAFLSVHFIILRVLHPSCKRCFLCRFPRKTHGLKIHVSAVRFRPQPDFSDVQIS